MENLVVNTNVKKPATINFLEKDIWNERTEECVKALETCKDGSLEERRIGLEKVIGTLYPMYGMGVIRNLADLAIKKFTRKSREAEIVSEIKEHFLSVWLDYDRVHDRRIALIGILKLAEEVSLFNEIFFSQKNDLEFEAKAEIGRTAYSIIGPNLGYWKHLPEYEKKKEIKEKAREVVSHFGKERIAKWSHRTVLELVTSAYEERMAEFTEKEKIRLGKEEKAAKEYADSLAVEQMARAVERKAAKEREKAENLLRLAEKKARKEERLLEVSSATMVNLSNGKRAKVLPTTDHVMHISPSQYAVVDGVVYLRTGNGVKKDEFVSVKKETKSSAPVKAATASAQKLPENLDEFWVNKGDKTVKVHVVPSWVLGDKEATFSLKFRGYEFIAVEDKGAYNVYLGSTLTCIGGGFKKATDEQKRLEKKRLAKTSRVGINLAQVENVGDFGEALLSAAIA